MEWCVIAWPMGRLRLEEENGRLCRVSFTGEAEKAPCTPLLCEAARQLTEYFAGERQKFDLPLETAGTPFQRAVWAELAKIPYGETRSYAQLAAAVGSPRACRAVGMANHRNPIAIVLPCHRVVGASGALTGYAGGLDKKRWLLELETADGPGGEK